jgi:hypothetical protein
MHKPHPFPHWETLPPLSDEAAAQILMFLQHWVEQFEYHYDGQLRRYYDDSTPDYPIERFPDSDPPF